MTCKTFKGGYCKKINTTVPRSWCLKRCQLGKNLIVAKPIKKPTIVSMSMQFTRAIAIWTAKGFPVCTKEDYTARRLECSKCTDKKRCPFCGCNLWLKAAILTSECKNWST